MRIVRIPKSKGRFRLIYAPSPEERERSNRHKDDLADLAREHDKWGVQHGFTKGRSCITNALVHVGWDFTLSMDLSEFFDHVTFAHIKDYLSEFKGPTSSLEPFRTAVAMDCFYDGAARQGLPSSPAIANLAAVAMDTEIMSLLAPKGRFTRQAFCYSRYCDDLTFSAGSMATIQMLMARVPEIVRKHGFVVNESKTHVQCAKSGRRIITGVAVDDHGVYPTRDVKRRLRAAEHQITEGVSRRTLRQLLQRQEEIRARKNYTRSLLGLFWDRYTGLREWAKLRMPKQPYVVHREPAKQQQPKQQAVKRTLVQRAVGLFSRKFA